MEDCEIIFVLFLLHSIGLVIIQLSPEFTLVKLDRVVHLMEPGGTRAGLDRVVHLMKPGNEAGLLPRKGEGVESSSKGLTLHLPDLLSWLHQWSGVKGWLMYCSKILLIVIFYIG